MASAWGLSWGPAWGNSWGTVEVVPEPADGPITLVPTYGVGGLLRPGLAVSSRLVGSITTNLSLKPGVSIATRNSTSVSAAVRNKPSVER